MRPLGAGVSACALLLARFCLGRCVRIQDASPVVGSTHRGPTPRTGQRNVVAGLVGSARILFVGSLLGLPDSRRFWMIARSMNGAARQVCSQYRPSIHGAIVRAAPVSGDGYRSAAVAE